MGMFLVEGCVVDPLESGSESHAGEFVPSSSSSEILVPLNSSETP